MKLQNGYAVISREWKSGDRIELELPMAPQRIKADEQVVADRGRVALRCGPLVYCIESVDQDVEGVLHPDTPLTTDWRPDLLGGVSRDPRRVCWWQALCGDPYYARRIAAAGLWFGCGIGSFAVALARLE